MPRCSDPARLRAILNRDRAWALYLLADLEPVLFGRGEWWCTADAVTLLYRGFDPPILCAFGAPDDIAALFDEMPRPPQFYLHVRPQIGALVSRHYTVAEPRHMIRMVLAREDFRPVRCDEIEPFGAADASALAALYRDGESMGESPGFFAPEMLDAGVYLGVRRNGEVIAVAGTHVLSLSESVAAIGNVYTRRDQRGRGLAAAATSAVATALFERNLTTVALSVNERNHTAIRIYQRLGFRDHCRFVEGVATRR